MAGSDSKVSRLHAVLERLSGVWCIRDLSARNGTFPNGERPSTSPANPAPRSASTIDARSGGSPRTEPRPRQSAPHRSGPPGA